MTKSIKEFRKKIKPEIQAAAREKAAGILADMELAEVEKSQGRNNANLRASV